MLCRILVWSGDKMNILEIPVRSQPFDLYSIKTLMLVGSRLDRDRSHRGVMNGHVGIVYALAVVDKKSFTSLIRQLVKCVQGILLIGTVKLI